MSSFRQTIAAIILGAVLLMLPSLWPMKPADTNVTVIHWRAP